MTIARQPEAESARTCRAYHAIPVTLLPDDPDDVWEVLRVEGISRDTLGRGLCAEYEQI